MAQSNGPNELAPSILCDGKFEIVRLTEKYHAEAEEIFRNCFMKYENICTAINIQSSEAAMNELASLFRVILKDGVSFGACSTENGQLVAIAINKILEPKSNLDLTDTFKLITSPKMVYIGSYLEHMENTYDIYKNLNIDCSMEIVFLSTRQGFDRKGLAKSLTAYSVQFARNFGNGLLSEDEFPKHIHGKRPKAVTSIFTSKFTQMIGEKLGFETVVTLPYSDLKFNGCTFSEKLEPMHEYSTFAVKKL